MSLSFKTWFFSSLFLMVGSSHALTCKEYLKSIAKDLSNQEFTWRQANTHSAPGSKAWKTSTKREGEIKKAIKEMEDDILQNDTTPGVELIQIDGVKMTDTGKGPSDSYGNAYQYQVTGLDKSKGLLHATLLLPVSGHLGAANAKKWAKSDTFSVTYRSSDGKSHDLVKNVKSLGLVTLVEIEVPLEKDKTVTLLYDRSGSAGPGGYMSGRTIELIWDGK